VSAVRLSPPSVFIVVLNHNGERWLQRCLQSLLACSYPRLEIVLVDNASTDGSVALARRLSGRLRIIENSENLGFCEGNNAGITYALERGADYVALLNNDTYVEPDWIDRLVEVGESSPSIGILGPVQLIFDGDEFNSWTTSALPRLLDALRERTGAGVWFPVEWVEGSCLLAKRQVFQRIGRLDPIFYAFFEECDLCRRARAARFQIALVPSSKVHHYRGGSYHQPSFSCSRALLLAQNSMLYNSSDPETSLVRNLVELLRNDATHLKSALLGTASFRVWFRANLAVARRLPALYRKWHADRDIIRRARLLSP
jgi:GT2 family glycosyltransferase